MATTLPNMGLVKWNSAGDYFSHTQLAANIQAIDDHDHSTGKGLQIPTGGIANGAVTGAKMASSTITATNVLDGTLTGAKLAANTVTGDKIATADLQKLGLSDSTIRRGYTAVATSQSRNNTAYGTLTTADQVLNVSLPTGGLIAVAYQAQWSFGSNGAFTANAAICLNNTPIKGYVQLPSAATSPDTQSAYYPNDTFEGTTRILTSFAGGLISASPNGAGQQQGISAPVTGTVLASTVIGTGLHTQQIGTTTVTGTGDEDGTAGGPCYIWADAGTYTVSVQFKSTGAAINVQNRKLWVWTIGF